MKTPTPAQVKELNELCNKYLYGTGDNLDNVKLHNLLNDLDVQPGNSVRFAWCPRCHTNLVHGVIWIVACHTTSGGCGLKPP